MMSTKGNVPAQYLAHGDPALKGYFPAWVNNLPTTPPWRARCWTASYRARMPSGQ
jgi:hypothetical protein